MVEKVQPFLSYEYFSLLSITIGLLLNFRCLQIFHRISSSFEYAAIFTVLTTDWFSMQSAVDTWTRTLGTRFRNTEIEIAQACVEMESGHVENSVVNHDTGKQKCLYHRDLRLLKLFLLGTLSYVSYKCRMVLFEHPVYTGRVFQRDGFK